MELKNGVGHLSYSTLVHLGDTWAEMNASLREFVPQVKKRISPDAPFAVSLRISASSAKTLTDSPTERQALAEFLAAEDLYVYTVNAFPYGPFKGEVVMERVYEPDWTTDDRVNYTNSVADILAEISPTHINPSIQTAPLAFKPNVEGEAYIKTFTRNVFRVIAHLRDLEERTGRRVKLAIEPEPACYLETTDETLEWFKDRIYSPAGIRELAEVATIPLSEAEGAARRYLGIVFDIGHQSVGFENITDSLSKIVNAGIPIFKLQEAASLWVEELTQDKIEALRRFTDTIYLSQTSLKQDGKITKFLNLGEALDAYEANPVPSEMRTHFHVPVFLEELGPFRTTRFGVQEALKMHRATPLSDHLEIETYTWDVLPPELKTGDIIEYVSRELEFVRNELIGYPMSEKIRLSLIGLGSMGDAMAHRVLDQGFELDIWNRSPKEIGDLLDKGARKVELAQALQNAFVLSLLSNDAAALDVFSEENLAKAKPGTIHINMSTLSPAASATLAERHAKHGIGYIAAPVLGRPIAITNGKLLIVAAGAAKDIEAASVVFEKVSAQHWNVGTDHAKSNLVKLGVNYNLIHALQAIGESVALVESGGVDPNTFMEILTHTAFSGSAYAGYGPMIVNRKYTPAGFSMALGLKDVKLVEDAAADLGLKLPVATVLHELFDKALADAELKELDWSAVAELTRQKKL